MLLSPKLAEYISACFTGLWIQSHEHEDALSEIAQLCQRESWRLATWDNAGGLQIPGHSGDSIRWPRSRRSTRWRAPTVRRCWYCRTSIASWVVRKSCRPSRDRLPRASTTAPS